MRRLLALAVALTVATPATAATWARLSRSTDGKQTWADVSSITEVQGIRTVWIRTVYLYPDRRGATSDLARFQYDCQSRETALMNVIYYDNPGSVISSDQIERPQWRPVVPDTVGEGNVNFVCSYPIGTNPRDIAGLVIEP